MRPVLNAARTVLRQMRRWTERKLHPSRRARARARLRTVGPGGTVLVVCHGNICRSPYAAAAIRRALAAAGLGATQVTSAGFIGPGRPAPEIAQLVARRRGIDLEGHLSCLIPPGAYSLIVVMDERQQSALAGPVGSPPVVLLGDLDPDPIQSRMILDPYDQPEPVFEAVYARIDRCVAELVSALRR